MGVSPLLFSFAAIKFPDNDLFAIYTPEAFECDLKWCGKSYSNASAINGTFVGELPDEINLANTTDRNRDPKIFSVFHPDGGATPYSGNRSFTVNVQDTIVIADFLEKLFTTGLSS